MNISLARTSPILLLFLLLCISSMNRASAQRAQTTAPQAEQALNSIIGGLHEHLKAWENASNLEEAKRANNQTRSQINTISKALTLLRRQPPKTEKAKQQLSELLEANLNLTNKRWDAIDKKLKANKTVYPQYLKASSVMHAHILKISATIYEIISPTSLQAK